MKLAPYLKIKKLNKVAKKYCIRLNIFMAENSNARRRKAIARRIEKMIEFDKDYAKKVFVSCAFIKH